MAVRKTRGLAFKWDEHFIPSETDCIHACFAMSARYWLSHYPDLNLSGDIEYWKSFAKSSFVEYRGTHLTELLRKMPKKVPNNPGKNHDEQITSGSENIEKPLSELVIKENALQDLDSLAPFFQTGPPIPQILVFNQLLMTHNINGPNHAVILHSVDYDKEKLFVIDSTKHNLKEPDVYDFRKFEKAWKDVQNLQIITYPKEMATLISGSKVGITQQLDLSQF